MNFSPKPYILLIIIAAAVVFSAGAYYAKTTSTSAITEVTTQAGTDNSSTGFVVVHVAGQVVNPGTYKFSSDKRVDDAIKEAIPLPDADLDSLNLAELLKDEQRIFVPSLVVQENTKGVSSSQGNDLININSAEQAELETLPGIGPTLAQRIIEYREVNGGFKTIEEIKSVSGIGDKRFEDIKDKITIY